MEPTKKKKIPDITTAIQDALEYIYIGFNIVIYNVYRYQ